MVRECECQECVGGLGLVWFTITVRVFGESVWGEC